VVRIAFQELWRKPERHIMDPMLDLSQEDTDNRVRAQKLLRIAIKATQDPRAKNFVFLGVWFEVQLLPLPVNKAFVKGFANRYEAISFLEETKGLKPEQYLVFEQEDDTVIHMC
jgi:hypothetical protein